MTRQWKSGDVAMIRTEGGDFEVLGLRDTHGWAHLKDWDSPHRSHSCWTTAEKVTVVRPVVIIDPEDREQVARLLDTLVDRAFNAVRTDGTGPNVTALAQAALRSLVAPEKPDEPTGWLAAVEDADGHRWVRDGLTKDRIGDGPWWHYSIAKDESYDGPLRAKWDEINAVRVLSPGVTEEATR